VRKTIIAAALLLGSAGASWAESTQADWDEHAKPIVDEFADCTRDEVSRLIDTTMTAVQVAQHAISACDPKLKPLKGILTRPPFNNSDQGAREAMAVVKNEARHVITADVENRRKE
jgi:hypothetical protein